MKVIGIFTGGQTLHLWGGGLSVQEIGFEDVTDCRRTLYIYTQFLHAHVLCVVGFSLCGPCRTVFCRTANVDTLYILYYILIVRPEIKVSALGLIWNALHIDPLCTVRYTPTATASVRRIRCVYQHRLSVLLYGRATSDSRERISIPPRRTAHTAFRIVLLCHPSFSSVFFFFIFLS